MMLRAILMLDEPCQDSTEIGVSLTPMGCEVLLGAPEAGGLKLVGECPVDLLVLAPDQHESDGLVVRSVVSYDGGTNGPAIHVGGHARPPGAASTGLAQMRDLLDRLPGRAEGPRSEPPYRHGDLLVDFEARRVQRGGLEITLARREFEVLAYLAHHAGKVRSVPDIFESVWGKPPTSASAASLWTYVRRLRKQIEPDPRRPIHLLSRPKLGYYVPAADPALSLKGP